MGLKERLVSSEFVLKSLLVYMLIENYQPITFSNIILSKLMKNRQFPFHLSLFASCSISFSLTKECNTLKESH